jgi:hypothetical protein
LAQKIDRRPDAGVAELDLWNNDAVELVGNPRGPARVAREGVTDWADRLAVLTDRLFPSFLDLPKLLRTGFVEGLFTIVRFVEIDSLFPVAGRDVVGIEVQDLLVFLEGEIVTAGAGNTWRRSEVSLTWTLAINFDRSSY